MDRIGCLEGPPRFSRRGKTERPMDHACSDFRSTCRLSRRSLLRAGTAGIAGLTLPNLLRAADQAGGAGGSVRARAKHVIFLHQFGGPSHLDTFDMKPDAPDGIRGEFKP